MSRLLWHGLLWLACRGLSSGSSSSRVFIEFPHCFSCLSGQLGLALGPFIRIILTALEAGGICFLARCQWRSWAWRIESEFLHVLGSNIPVLPPLSCPSPLYSLNAHFALILGFLSMSGLIRSAIVLVYVIRDLKSSIDLRPLSSLLWLLSISHFLQMRNLNNGIL